MSSLGENFGERLRDSRGKNSQEALGKAIGVDRATINRWENHGAGTATLDHLERASTFLKRGIEYLLGIEQKVDLAKLAKNAAFEAVSSGLTNEEKALLAKFRNLPDDDREYFLHEFDRLARIAADNVQG